MHPSSNLQHMFNASCWHSYNFQLLKYRTWAIDLNIKTTARALSTIMARCAAALATVCAGQGSSLKFNEHQQQPH
jgi:hypothetical protein